jgi:hypothetical protein
MAERDGERAWWRQEDPVAGDAPARPAAPGLPGPASAPTAGPLADGEPGPGMAAPGRHGWARSGGTYTPSVSDGGANKAVILGVISLLASVFWCGLVLGPAAIIEGVKLLRRIRASGGGLRGRPQAITAIVLGSLASFLSGLGLLATVVVAFS